MCEKVLILGFGYTAYYFVREILNDSNSDYQITATSRNPDVKIDLIKNLDKSKFKLIDFNQDLSDEFEQADYILVSIAPNEKGEDAGYLACLKNIAFDSKQEGQIKKPKWIAYLSSTSVYGNYDGAWVDENSELKAISNRGLNRIKAENSWLSLKQQYHIPTYIFRLAGIYGPGSSVIDRIKNGNKTSSVYKPEHFFSRIHVEDIARVLKISMHNLDKSGIYNLCDDSPTPGYIVDAYAAELLDMPKLELIPLEQAGLSNMAKEFYQDNRKVSNAKVKQQLGYEFLYPDYKLGLQSII